MPRFIVLVDFTKQGVAAIEKTVERSEVVREMAKKHGAEIKDIYWTLGSHDGVLIFDAPDDHTATTLLLNVGKAGNVTTETLRAFDQEDMGEIVSKMS